MRTNRNEGAPVRRGGQSPRPQRRQIPSRGRGIIHSPQRGLKLLLLGAFAIIPWPLLRAQSQPVPATQVSRQEMGTVITVPPDTRIPLTLVSAISSKTAYVGQAIYCQTVFPITVGDQIAIPVGSYVRGSITQVVHAGHFRKKAKLGLRFDTLTLPDGATRPLRATLSSFAGNGQEGFSRKEGKINGPSNKGRNAGRIARATITGAEIGTLAGISGGHTLRGLGVGSAAGGAAGVIWVLASRGKQIYLPRGTNLELQLAQSLTLTAEAYRPERIQSPEEVPPRLGAEGY
jgi:hypothetical protein